MSLAPYFAGVDLGGTNMALGIVGPGGRIKARSKIPTRAHDGSAVILKRMADEIVGLIHRAGLTKARIRAIGVGSPGPLSAQTGTVFQTPNLPGWRSVRLAAIIEKRTHLKTFLENDANCAALGEAVYGAGKGCQNVVVLTLGTGVGGGLIINGELFSGPDTTGGELGHFSIDKDGPPCGCGQRGCIEMFASAQAMALHARELLSKKRRGPLWKLCGGDLSKVTSKMAHDALQKGDPIAKEVWKRASWALATAVGGYINVFNPDKVILFGGVMLGGEELLEAVRRKARAYPQPLRRAKIVRAKLGDDAGIVGAAEVAKRSVLAGHAI